MAGRYHSRREKKKLLKKLFLVCGIFVSVCSAAVVAMGALEKRDTSRSSTEEFMNPDIVEVDGVQYVPKKNIEVYLFMGIDDKEKVRKKEEYDGSGQADMLMLMVRDISTGTYKTLPLDRNTMTEVKSLDIDGNYLATTVNQLALSHSDGDGMEISCENTVDAVSNLLYGQEIDGYAAVNMGAMETLNHLVGGVTVTIEDDFSKTDPSLVMGETITLTDEQAAHYIHDRQNVGDESNEGRIRRQSTYLKALEPKLKELCNEDASYPDTVYDAIEEYMVTNISKQKFSKIALLAAKDKSEGQLRIEGTTTIGEMEFEEFYPDEESLEEVVLELFYKEYD